MIRFAWYLIAELIELQVIGFFFITLICVLFWILNC